jgi:hypothetical protein
VYPKGIAEPALIEVGTEDFFVTRRGILKARELVKQDFILGSQNGRLEWSEVEKTERASKQLHDVYLEHTELACHQDTKLSIEGSQPRRLSDVLREFQTYGTTHIRVEKCVITPEIVANSDYKSKEHLDLSPFDFYFLGMLIRRVAIYDEMFLRVRKTEVEEMKRTLGSILPKLGFSLDLEKQHGEREDAEQTWCWLEIEDKKLRSFLSKIWPLPTEIPLVIRQATWLNLRSFMEGACTILLTRTPDGLEMQTFRDERDMRLLLNFYATLVDKPYVTKPVPLYNPILFRFSSSSERRSFSNVRAVVRKGESETVKIQSGAKNWYPLVNLTFVG